MADYGDPNHQQPPSGGQPGGQWGAPPGGSGPDYGGYEDRAMPTVVYVLYLLGLFHGLTLIIGVIMAYVLRGSAGPANASHYTYLIRTFWVSLVAGLAGMRADPGRHPAELHPDRPADPVGRRRGLLPGVAVGDRPLHRRARAPVAGRSDPAALRLDGLERSPRPLRVPYSVGPERVSNPDPVWRESAAWPRPSCAVTPRG